MRTTRYVPFIPKTNEVDNVDSAHINLLQDVIKELQEGSFQGADSLFTLRALNALFHSGRQNSLFLSGIENNTNNFWDWDVASNIIWSEEERALVLSDDQLHGTIRTQAFTPEETPWDALSILVDASTPGDSSIHVSYSTDDGTTFHSIVSGDEPITPLGDAHHLIFRVTMTRTQLEDYPRFESFAVFVLDPFYENDQFHEIKEFEFTYIHNEMQGWLTDLSNHIANVHAGVHGSTSENVGCKIPIRDEHGQFRISDPIHDDHPVTLGYMVAHVASALGSITSHINQTSYGIHGSTSQATESRLVHRDGLGRAKINTPQQNLDIANKQYVDETVANVNFSMPEHDHDERYALANFSRITVSTEENQPTNAQLGDIWIVIPE